MTGWGKKSSKKKKFALGVSQHNLPTFGCAEGLPSDDSEDSDYQPSDGEQPSTSKRKRGMVLRDQLLYFIDVGHARKKVGWTTSQAFILGDVNKLCVQFCNNLIFTPSPILE
jgi:hypothetical protein